MFDVKFLFDYRDEINQNNISDQCVKDMLDLYEMADNECYKEVTSFDFYFGHCHLSFIEYLDEEFISFYELKSKIKNKDISIYKKTIEILEEQYKATLRHVGHMIYNAFLDLYYDDESRRTEPHIAAYSKFSLFSEIGSTIDTYELIRNETVNDLEKLFRDAINHTNLNFTEEEINTAHECVFEYL